METLSAAESLAALGHETRLTIYRALVQAGPSGLNAGAVGERLGLAPATLCFHLAHLSRVGLIRGRQDGRFIYYSADYSAMDELISFLTDVCGQQSVDAAYPGTVSLKLATLLAVVRAHQGTASPRTLLLGVRSRQSFTGAANTRFCV